MIRLIMERDAEPFLKLCRKIDEETEFMLFEEGERATTIEQQQNIIKKYLNLLIQLFLLLRLEIN